VKSTGYTYPQVRVFYSPHPQESKLPALPILVFVHGLGGSVAQFHPLLTSLSNFAPCLAIDLPGCGVSKYAPRYWDAYTTNSLAQLLIEVINRFREEDQEIVFICHSMGCSLGALLSSTTSPFYTELGQSVSALIAMCPPNKPLEPSQANQLRCLSQIQFLTFGARGTGVEERRVPASLALLAKTPKNLSNAYRSGSTLKAERPSSDAWPMEHCQNSKT
jgi:pimeloyl-ACP methyl ester carboxylesterase